MSKVRKQRNPIAESLADDQYHQRIVQEVVKPSRAKIRAIERMVQREWIGASITDYRDEEEDDDNVSPTL